MRYLKNKLRNLIRGILKEELNKIDDTKRNSLYKRFNFDSSVKFGRVKDIYLIGDNIFIGKNSYFNSGMIQSGPNSKVVIGEWCAIGYNVNIISVTHDVEKPTGPVEERKSIESDIIISDNCWIGSNVFIKEGVTIGDNSIIAANSVVAKSVEPNSIVGGVPARLIRKK